jgi:hypothetical protein
MRKGIPGGLLAVLLAACAKPEGPVVWAANHEMTGPTRFQGELTP